MAATRNEASGGKKGRSSKGEHFQYQIHSARKENLPGSSFAKAKGSFGGKSKGIQKAIHGGKGDEALDIQKLTVGGSRKANPFSRPLEIMWRRAKQTDEKKEGAGSSEEKKIMRQDLSSRQTSA